MAACTARATQAQSAERQVEIVADDKERGRVLQAVFKPGGAQGNAAAIHVGLRERNRYSVFTDAQLVGMGRFA